MAGQIKLRWAAARSCVVSERHHHGREERQGGSSVAETLVRLVYRVVRAPGETVETETGQGRLAETSSGVETSRQKSGDNRWRRNSCSDTQTSSVSQTQTSFSSLRRTLLSGVLGRVTSSQASELRRRALDQLTLNGDSQPFLALLGVSLASGSGEF